MPRFNIHHITKYVYESPVRESSNQVILYPLKDEFQEVLKHHLTITGEPSVNLYTDYYGNQVGCFMHAEPHRQLEIDSKLEVITKEKPIPADIMPAADQWQKLDLLKGQVQFIDFLREQNADISDQIGQIIEPVKDYAHTPMKAALELNKYIFDNFSYIQGITTVETTLEEILTLKAGVCQDFAHLLLSMLRRIRIPARYVSGYVCPNKNGTRGAGATHAWVEAYLPYYGWLGFDPTNNTIATDRYVRLAVGRNFNDCTPVKGTYRGTSEQTLEVGVTVSYENENMSDNPEMFLVPQPEKTPLNNSYRRFVERKRYEEQQQQQQ
jgi:transglutaminase-like putative cysteine protease